MLAKFFGLLERHLSSAVVVGALVTLVSSCVTGVATASVAYAQVKDSIVDVGEQAREAGVKSSELERRLTQHIDDEKAAREKLREEIRDLRVEQFDAAMNTYISCLVSKQKDPTLPFECQKPTPPRESK